jgi:hypothetical protein
VELNQNPKVIDLINEAERGTLVLPDFQRSFIWEPEGVRELLVSVLGNYFIGSILLLQQFKDDSPFALRLVQGIDVLNPSTQIQTSVKILLDGQQRVTALCYALNEPNIPLKNRSSSYRFYLDLDQALKREWDDAVKAVSLKDKKQLSEISRNPRAIPFKTIRNLKEITRLFKQDPQFTEIFEIANDFLGREVYAIELSKDTTPERIVETFERINRTGKPLKAFELLTARLYKSGIRLRDLLAETNRTYTFPEYVEPDVIPKAIAIFRDKIPKKKIVLELEPENFPEDWERACEAIEDAYRRILDIKNGYGAFDFDRWVPYSTMMVPLASMLDYIKNSKRESKKNYDKIDRWYWTSVFSNRYDQAADTRSFSDFSVIRDWVEDDSKVPDFIANYDPISLDWSVDKQSSATYRGMLNLVVLSGALDFQTGQPPQFDIKHVQDDHIFPKSVYRTNVFLNRTLITKNLDKSDDKPSDYFRGLVNQYGRNQVVAILNTHLIPEEALNALLKDDLPEFLRLRGFAQLNALRMHLGLQPLDDASRFVLETPKRRVEPSTAIDVEEDESGEGQNQTEARPRKSWNEILRWSSKSELADKFIQAIKMALPEVVGEPHDRWYWIYAGEPTRRSNLFLVIILNKYSVCACIRAEAGSLADPENLTHGIKGWFFEGSERRFYVTEEHLDYCVNLAKQAYDKRLIIFPRY